jgi:shikimate 5-dehydrogenase
MVLVAGLNATARALAHAIRQRGGVLILASHNRAAAQELAAALGCRHIQFDALYSTMHDVLVVCDEEKEHRPRGDGPGIHPGYLKPGLTVLDLTATLHKSPLVRQAEARGCTVVDPRQLRLDQLLAQAHLLTGKDVPREVLAEALPLPPDEE